jgi:hypothetical protein
MTDASEMIWNFAFTCLCLASGIWICWPELKRMKPPRTNPLDPDFSHHRITVAQLKALLGQLKDTDVLWPNKVHNLSIFREDEDSRNEIYAGYVDFNPPGVVDWDEE